MPNVRVCDYLESTEHGVLLRLKYPPDGIIAELEKKCQEASRPGYKCEWTQTGPRSILVTGTLNQVAVVKHWAISSTETIIN